MKTFVRLDPMLADQLRLTVAGAIAGGMFIGGFISSIDRKHDVTAMFIGAIVGAVISQFLPAHPGDAT